LKKVNDLLSNGISELTMFKQWNLMEDKLFSSLDGKKITARRKNIMARFSSKYFGLCSGLVSYSMIANHVCVNSKIIGANEHETWRRLDGRKELPKVITGVKFYNGCGVIADKAIAA
jgi:hypothetical protein